MGFNTPVLFLNDGYGDFESHPMELAQNILDAMRQQEQSKEYAVGSFGNPMQALRAKHADVHRLILVHGNRMYEFVPPGQFSNENITDEWLLKLRENDVKEARRTLRLYAESLKQIRKQFAEIKKDEKFVNKIIKRINRKKS